MGIGTTLNEQSANDRPLPVYRERNVAYATGSTPWYTTEKTYGHYT